MGEINNIVFFIGCARSGTSILGELLGSHPDITYIGEKLQPFWHGFSPTPDHHEQDAGHVSETIVAKANRKMQGLSKGRIIVDKVPPNALRLPFLSAIFPDAKFIHIIRDGLDVACSLKPGLEADWGHLKPQGWQQMSLHSSSLMRGALLWRYVVEKVENDFIMLGIKNRYTIKYESLVWEPEIVALLIIKFIGLPMTREVETFCKQKIDNDARHGYQAAGQTFWRTDDHSRRIGRWQENMDPSEASQVRSLLRQTLEVYGHQI